MKTKSKLQHCCWTILAILAFHYSSAWSSELFREVSDEVGLTWKEGGPYEVLSVNWTDVNTDGFPDLWLMPHGCHWNQTDYIAGPQLFINQAGTSFVDQINSIWPKTNQFGRDAHSATWGDFDNDGDPDVFINGGGTRGKDPSALHERTLLVNEGGMLTDLAPEFGLDLLFGSGRGAMWLDWNKDGWLDLMYFNKTLEGNVIHPSQLFAQTDQGFVDMTKPAGFTLNREQIDGKDSVLFGVVSDLFGDQVTDIVLFGSLDNFLTRVYRHESPKLKNLTKKFPIVPSSVDAVVADFNQDTIPDIFITQRNGLFKSMIVQGEDKTYLLGYFKPSKNQEHGMSFKNSGEVTFDCQANASSIFVGQQGVSPKNRFFTLSPTSQDVQGLAPRSKPGTYLGYDPLTETWTVLVAVSSKSDVQTIDVTAKSDLSEVTPINFTPPDFDKLNKDVHLPIYLEYDPERGKYVERTTSAGFTRNLFAYSVVAGDFDNDMDQDLYFRQALNDSAPMQSVYYENQGDGTFVEVEGANGATVRILRAGLSIPFGQGPVMAIADYDQNGFLDIFTAAEVRMTQSRYFHVGVPVQLFQNQGNGNHWIQIDLVGTVSARDAIGAKVLVHTPDGKVQVRIQDGGHHLGGQNQRRLHFGLGANTVVKLIEVVWPTGNVSSLDDVVADQVLSITE